MINEVLLGDCLELMKDIPDNSIDMVLCDLPYGTTQCKWDTVIELDKLWIQYNRVCKKNAAIVLTAAQPFTSNLVMSNPKYFKYNWIWEKSKATGYLNAKKMPMRAHEDVCVFYRKPPTYNPQMVQGEPYNKGTAHRPTSVYGAQGMKEINKKRKELDKILLKENCLQLIREEMDKMELEWTTIDKIKTMEEKIMNAVKPLKTTVKNDTGLRYPRTVQYFKTAESEGKKSIIHPTQKPLALFEYLIKTYTNEGDLVLDNCIGGGTTAVACINTNRRYIGMELDEEYYEKCLERIKKVKEKLDK